MSTVEVRDELHAPVERVWELLSDFGNIERWNPYPQRVEVRGEGIGMVRTVTARDGQTADEVLFSCDPERHVMSYSVVPASTGAGFALTTQLTTTIELSGDAGGRTTVTWQAQSDGDMDDGLRGALAAALRLRIDALAEHLARN